MPRKTKVGARATAPKSQTRPTPQGFIPLPDSKVRVDELRDSNTSKSKFSFGAKPPQPRSAPAPGLGLSPAALAASVGIALALVGQTVGSSPKEEEVKACAECLAAVAAKYTTIKYAEEIALATTLGAVTFRMFIEGKRARAEASRSSSARPEGDGQVLLRA